MKVGIDYWPATTHAPGVGRYVRELVRALVGHTDRPELALFDIGPGARTLPAQALGLPDESATPRLRRERRSWSRRLFGPLAADRWLGGVDLFHRAFPDRPRTARALEILPVAEVPTSTDSPAFRRALQRAAHVIVFSHAARAELLERFHLPAGQVSHLPVGCDHWRRDLGLTSVPTRARERFVVLGARTRARSPRLIAQAFLQLVEQGLDAELEFIGRTGPDDAALLELNARPSMQGRLLLTEPREAELPMRVASASVLVHLNSTEHTPVTPLEAFSLGLAVVASRLPAFEEALLDEPVWVLEPTDRRHLCEALRAGLELARDPDRRAARIALANEYTWHAHARKTIELWREVLARA